MLSGRRFHRFFVLSFVLCPLSFVLFACSPACLPICICLQWTIGFHAITAFFMMIAWSVWAGQVNANRNPSTYASLGIYTLGLVNGTLAPVPHQSVIEGTPITVAPVTDVSMWFGGGFGLAVTSFILSVLAGVVIFFFHVEKVQAPDATHPNAASATAPGPGAYIGTAGEGAAAYSGVDAHTGTRNSLPFPPAATEGAYRTAGYGNDDAPSNMNDVKI